MTPTPAAILVLHAAATWAMTGLIWFVQLVHYPAYRDIGAADFTAFQRRSPARTGRIVGPLMAAELGSAVWLLWWRPLPWLSSGALWLGAALIAICWLSTILWQVPLHLRLTASRDPATVERLIRSNWIRTVAWSLRAVLVATWLLPR